MHLANSSCIRRRAFRLIWLALPLAACGGSKSIPTTPSSPDAATSTPTAAVVIIIGPEIVRIGTSAAYSAQVTLSNGVIIREATATWVEPRADFSRKLSTASTTTAIG